MTKTFNPVNWAAGLLVAALLASPASPAPERGTDSVGLATAAHTPAVAGQAAILSLNKLAGVRTLSREFSLDKVADSNGKTVLELRQNGAHLCNPAIDISTGKAGCVTSNGNKYHVGWGALQVLVRGNRRCTTVPYLTGGQFRGQTCAWHYRSSYHPWQ